MSEEQVSVFDRIAEPDCGLQIKLDRVAEKVQIQMRPKGLDRISQYALLHAARKQMEVKTSGFYLPSVQSDTEVGISVVWHAGTEELELATTTPVERFTLDGILRIAEDIIIQMGMRPPPGPQGPAPRKHGGLHLPPHLQ